ncbi:response regulator [Clostridia bacterium]|nr:response regulator [Clostridia bacterium]
MGQRKKIMMVDDNHAHLTTGKEILKNHYEVYDMPSASKMFKFLEKVTPELIISDVDMPDMDGYAIIKKLKSDPRWESIPVMFLTSKFDDVDELRGLELGAVDYVQKPFSAPRLLKRIENQILIAEQREEIMKQSMRIQEYNNTLELKVKESVGQVLELQTALLNTVAELVEFRDDITGGHTYRTQRYFQVLIDEMKILKLYEEQWEKWNVPFVVSSAQLHDVGKIAISDTILKKPGKLTDEEFDEMKKHTSIGVTIIERIEGNTSKNEFLQYAKIIAGTHHEKWDGSGYPYALSGEQIPLLGRLMAICDVYDALIAERPYKKPFTQVEAIDIILKGRGSHFDPQLVDIFMNVTAKFDKIAKSY